MYLSRSVLLVVSRTKVVVKPSSRMKWNSSRRSGVAIGAANFS
jgi:hypothetical protein